MKIQVNNKETEFPAGATVSLLAARFDLPDKGTAIAVNNRLVPHIQWESYPLVENDSVVIIKAACGG